MAIDYMTGNSIDTNYDCLQCKHKFVIKITELEQQSCLDPERSDKCPQCAQRVGKGPVQCRKCGGYFEVAIPHWHVQCNLASGTCPICECNYVTACIC